MDIIPRKKTRIVTLSQHDSMTVRDIAAVVGVENPVLLGGLISKRILRQCLQNERVNGEANARPDFERISCTKYPYNTSRDLWRELFATIDSSTKAY
ncbi:hypothetical protein TNCV_3566051 [Trichonephila clavipes]|nr:hypothetical protein TNCV_3566051 [Trichonephila clavipes]